MTDTTRPDHAPRAILSERAHNSGEAIRITLQAVQGHVSRMENIADQLAAENVALRDALRGMAGEIASHRRRGYPDNIERDRQSLYKEFGVAHLFDRDE